MLGLPGYRISYQDFSLPRRWEPMYLFTPLVSSCPLCSELYTIILTRWVLLSLDICTEHALCVTHTTVKLRRAFLDCNWVQTPPLSAAGLRAVGSLPQFPHLWSGNNKNHNTDLVVFLWGLSEQIGAVFTAQHSKHWINTIMIIISQLSQI